jgi:hypothetical protein
VMVDDAGWTRHDADAVFALPPLTAAACVLRLLQKISPPLISHCLSILNFPCCVSCSLLSVLLFLLSVSICYLLFISLALRVCLTGVLSLCCIFVLSPL